MGAPERVGISADLLWILEIAEEQRILWKESGHNLDAFLRDRPELEREPGFRRQFQRFLKVLSRAESILEREEIERIRQETETTTDDEPE